MALLLALPIIAGYTSPLARPVVPTERAAAPVVMRNNWLSPAPLVGAFAALTIGMAPISAAPAAELQLADFESSSLVSDGLKTAGMEGDLRMIKLWARLKAGALEAEGREAEKKVSSEQGLANARMRVRSVAPYLEEAQRDVFAAVMSATGPPTRASCCCSVAPAAAAS